jgi:hypothetical protein
LISASVNSRSPRSQSDAQFGYRHTRSGA